MCAASWWNGLADAIPLTVEPAGAGDEYIGASPLGGGMNQRHGDRFFG